jgi:hypothetical protein
VSYERRALLIRAEVDEAGTVPLDDTVTDVEHAVRLALESEGFSVGPIDVQLMPAERTR